VSGEAESPRDAAFRLLRDVEAGEYADRSARRRLASLGRRDRALALELAYGVIRLRARLDHELAHFVDRRPDRVEPRVRSWLRLGLYQLRELRIPDHAAVGETVEGVRRTVGARATGFVNGVLRAAARHGDRSALFPDAEADPVSHLTTWGSHPEWLVRRWLERWGRDRVVRLVQLDNEAPPVAVRLLEDPPAAAGSPFESAVRRLAETGLRLDPVPGFERCAELREGTPEALLARVRAVVQDPAASAVVDYVDSPPRGPFLDACSAPGGKALALADALGTEAGAEGGWPFVAADRSRSRLRRVAEGAERLGLPVSVVVADARKPAVRDAGGLLLDAPCTGTGTLRRRPDARWRLGPHRLRELMRLQEEMLDACAGAVRPGGVLVYATCSLEPEENEEQVERFLDRHPGFAIAAEPASGAVREHLQRDGSLFVRPWRFGTDGAYAARLVRSGA